MHQTSSVALVGANVSSCSRMASVESNLVIGIAVGEVDGVVGELSVVSSRHSG